MSLSERDKNIIWHPYTQMKTSSPAIGIVKGEGAWLFDEGGNKYLDAISSWWTNIHGHAHPHLATGIARQAEILEHVIFAGFTHGPAVRLAELLLGLLPKGQRRVFYSDNGSTAVEVALKMAFQYWGNQGKPRTKVIALEGAYHGDTFGAMSVSGRSAFTKPFDEMMFGVEFVSCPLPGKEEQALQELKSVLNKEKGNISAFIYEPVVQGTAGMRVMSAIALDEMIAFCRKEDVLCIADEVMTGFGRTGKMFASEHLSNLPDIVCLSKGLTGGMMALGVTTSTENIFESFLSDDRMKTLFHGHSYTANPIACSAGIASLELFETENTMGKVNRISSRQSGFAQTLRTHQGVNAVSCMGVILAVELKTGGFTGYFNPVKEDAATYFAERSILIRPLGNILYIMPPYCISDQELDYIYSVIVDYLDSRKEKNESKKNIDYEQP
jgi:adenosylmethionine-8-amino-7-oxononanoate aminotransferase